MERATTSFPVPLSPRMSTVESLGATLEMNAPRLPNLLAFADEAGGRVELLFEAEIFGSQGSRGRVCFRG